MLSPLPRRSVWAYCFAHFSQPRQPSPKGSSGRPAHRPFRGLLGVHSRYGLHTRAVTSSRPALRRLQPLRYLHSCSGCFRLERLPGGTCTHWKAPPCHGAHPTRTSAEGTESFQSRHRRCRSSDIAAVSGSPSPLWQAESAADRLRSGEAGGIRHRGHWGIVLTSRKAGRSTWNRF